jgi:hypothetical protein
MRVGSGRANQFGSCPKLPTWTKPTPLSLAHSFKPRSIAIILLSNSEAGRAILGGSFILFRLGIAWRTTSQGIWFQGPQQRTSYATYFTALARLSLTKYTEVQNETPAEGLWGSLTEAPAPSLFHVEVKMTLVGLSAPGPSTMPKIPPASSRTDFRNALSDSSKLTDTRFTEE